MLRFVPGMYIDEILWIREGEKKVIPGTDEQYVLENKKFTMPKYMTKKRIEKYIEAAIDRWVLFLKTSNQT